MRKFISPKWVNRLGFGRLHCFSAAIRQPIEDLAKHAVEMLLSSAQDHETLLQAKLVIRDSTAMLGKTESIDGAT